MGIWGKCRQYRIFLASSRALNRAGDALSCMKHAGATNENPRLTEFWNSGRSHCLNGRLDGARYAHVQEAKRIRVIYGIDVSALLPFVMRT